MTALACIGHWYSQLLYLVPIAVMGGAVAHQRLKQRLRERRERGSAQPRRAGYQSGTNLSETGVN